MLITLHIIFWTSVFIIFHSYILYPLILKLHLKKNKINKIFYDTKEECPKVSILLSIFNEELVITEKIESIINSNYPKNNIELLIGSDNSTDKSNEIITKYSQNYDFIKVFLFKSRQGKPSIINQIKQNATGEILILTDANVIFHKDTIFEIARHFKNPEIGLVDTNMNNKGLSINGISIPESTYISHEVKTKNYEGNIWGTMMGPFGGCYAIKSELYEQVPSNFLVDDFYINMNVLEKGYKAINNLNAIVYEDVSNNFKDEFRRKIRIATGNFQNLKKYKSLLLGLFGLGKLKLNKNSFVNPFGLAFSFLSHKVLRWIIPFFIIILLITNILLIIFSENCFQDFFIFTILSVLFSFLIPLFDFIFKKIKINLKLLRFISHFYGMNLALLLGFFKYIKGVKSGIWQPTKRNQTG